jgi:hypothetical protein
MTKSLRSSPVVKSSPAGFNRASRGDLIEVNSRVMGLLENQRGAAYVELMKIHDYTKFVSTHRERFVIEQNNTFGFAFSKVTRYWQFLEIIYERNQMASRAFIENTKAVYETLKPGTHPLTDKQQRLSE